MAKNTDPKGSFPTAGTSVATSVQNLSGAPSKNTKPVAKKTQGRGASPTGTKANRQGIQERLGAKCAPQATLYAANAAEASATTRNVTIVPSAVGNRDFYLRRQYGQGV